MSTQTVQQIPSGQIVTGTNDRKHFDANRLAELAENIASIGLLQPVTVRQIEGGNLFELIAGERRYRATQLLGWPEVPCLVADLTDQEASKAMLAENAGRADLDIIEEANAYQSRMTRFGWSAKKISEIAGVSVERVKKYVSLLALRSDIQHLIAKGHFPLGHALAMVTLDYNRQSIAVRLYNNAKAMTLANFRVIVSELLLAQSQDSLFDIGNFFMLQTTPVELASRGKKALVGVPTRSDLPAPVIPTSGSASNLIMGYIAKLQADGFASEAGAIGTLYTAMIKGNYMGLPA